MDDHDDPGKDDLIADVGIPLEDKVRIGAEIAEIVTEIAAIDEVGYQVFERDVSKLGLQLHKKIITRKVISTVVER